MSNKVRLRDVAELASVSEATVSRVLNEKPGVSDSTRRTVLDALGQLGYRAVGMSRHHSAHAGTVGIIVPELDNPVFPALAQALERQLAARDLVSMICTSTSAGMQEDDYVAALLDQDAAGFVFVSGLHANNEASSDRYIRLLDRQLPLVFINGYVEDLPIPAFDCDERFAFEQSVTHLRSLGHVRIGCAVGHHRYIGTRRKIDGYLSAMGHDRDTELLVESVYSIEGGRLATRRLLDRGATAVVYGSDLMAFGGITAAEDRGLRVPEDFSAIGFDDAGASRVLRGGLTSLRQPIEDMAAAAVASFSDQMLGRDVARGEILFRPELVVRGTTGRAPD